MIDPDVRRVLDTTVVAHLATVLPDGAPHSVPVWIAAEGERIAIITGPGYRPTRNMARDPRVAWEIVDRISTAYIGVPYPRDEQRVVALIEPEHQIVGMRRK